jgi:hypothetical protein
MATHRWRRAVIGALVLSFVLSACKFSGFYDPEGRSAAARATAWLVAQQQPDGGFELASFPGFETPDAILAIAENAQQQVDWNVSQARQAVKARTVGGRSALDAVDDFADGTISATQAAKLIVLVAKPLGYSPAAFNPQGDATSTNLLAAVNAGRQADGSYGTFNGTLYAVLARKLTNSSVLASTVSYIRAAQQADGGWNFAGDPQGTDLDADSTALALQALIAAGAMPGDADVVQGLAFLARLQQPDGAWPSFGADDPNSTASAILAVTAAGYDSTATCWRDAVDPTLAGRPYASPVSWLRSRQLPDGRIASPNDEYPPVNTFATTQTVEALRRGWLPVAWHDPQPC